MRFSKLATLEWNNLYIFILNIFHFIYTFEFFTPFLKIWYKLSLIFRKSKNVCIETFIDVKVFHNVSWLIKIVSKFYPFVLNYQCICKFPYHLSQHRQLSKGLLNLKLKLQVTFELFIQPYLNRLAAEHQQVAVGYSHMFYLNKRNLRNDADTGQ